VRSLSAVTGVLLVAVVYRLGTRMFGGRAGLLAAFLAAVSPFQNYYAQETRMYMLLALLGALAIWASFELMANQEPGIRYQVSGRRQPATHSALLLICYGLLYLLSATLGLYTHYAFPVILVATNVAALAHLWQSRQAGHIARGLVGWLGLQLIPLALYLPWLPIAWRQLTTWPAPSAGAGNALVTLWRTLVLGPAGGEASNWWLLGFGLLGLIGVVRLARGARLPMILLVLLYLGLPVGLTLVLFKPAYLKFLLVASPAICWLLAVGLVGGHAGRGVSWPAWLGAGLAAAAAWGPLTAYYADPAVARDDYRGMAGYLEAVAGPGDAIILNAAGQQEVFGYYYRGDTPVYALPRRRPLDPAATLTELEALLARSRRVFALYWATDESDPAGVIEGWLDEHAFKAADAWVGNVRLVSYAAPLPAGDLLPAEVRFGDHVKLTGYRVLAPFPDEGSAPKGDLPGTLSERTVPGEIVQVQLRWVTDAPLGARYVVFLQALDGASHLAGQRDTEPVISTPDWKPGQPVFDRHGVFIEPGTPPGVYRLIAGLYDATSGQRLTTGGDDFLELGTLTVERPAVPPPLAALRFRHPTSAELGPLHLLGYERYKLGHSYDPDTPLHPGDALHLVLYWQAQERPQADWRLALQVTPVGNPAAPVAEGVFPVAGLDYPATQWEPGEVVRAQFDLLLPGDAVLGDYQVSVYLVDETGSPMTGVFSLTPISLE
jgi:hypothetical protein